MIARPSASRSSVTETAVPDGDGAFPFFARPCRRAAINDWPMSPVGVLRPGAGERMKASDADDQSADPEAPGRAEGQEEGAGAPAVAAEARRLYARLHD